MPPKKTTSAAPKPDDNAPVLEEYGSVLNSIRDELAAQPWAVATSNSDEFEEGAPRRTLVETIPGGGVKVTEGGQTKIIKAGKKLTEAEAGDTFNRTLYSEGGLSEGYLTNEARVVAMRQSLIMYRDDPMYRAIIDGFTYFVIGKGLKFKARDENPAVQEHLDAFWKESKMDGRDADIVRRFFKYGEVLIRYFKTGAGGGLAKTPRVRLVPFWRIDTMSVDAVDPETLKGFKLNNYNVEGFSSGPAEELAADDVQYLVHSENSGGRGEPPFLVAMRACKWYADFILNRVTLNRYRTAFVLFKKITAAGPSRVSTVDNAASNATATGKNGQPQKRLPKPGTVVVHNSGIEYEWKSPQTGAIDGQADGKMIKSYIAAGAMVPEFLLGDASQANQDNSLVADNPFVRKVEFYQDYFEDVFGEMFKRVIEQGIATGKIPKTSTETVLTEAGAMRRTTARALRKIGFAEAAAAIEKPGKTTKAVPTSTAVDIDWPTLIQKDALKEAQTLAIDASLGLVSVETMRGKRGYDDEVEEKRLERDREQGQDAMAAARDEEIDAEDGDEQNPPAKTKKDKGAE
ncbi:MAG: hypothetical protein KGZ65_04180 [Sphingomonadales bacterium]|nr:hypothetical protein [Sphingomonadaceae bacterium]MBS3930411.1 hypothetical protein [Sphingomonadales bacterium]